jgi:hypothetical protein
LGCQRERARHILPIFRQNENPEGASFRAVLENAHATGASPASVHGHFTPGHPTYQEMPEGAKTFFHPDFTVGPGISPESAPKRSRAVTAGREFHPALKVLLYVQVFYRMVWKLVNLRNRWTVDR